MKKYICTVCGYIHEGDAPPEVCPICKVGADKFEEVQGEMQWADEHRIGVARDIDKDIIEGLRANFVGECTEVGMYLAMARQADREGYPEVAEAYKRIAFEEAEHASKFAELLGEVVVADTQKNLEMRDDFTETDALANRFTIGGKSQCIQIRMFCIPQGEIGSRKCNAVSFRNTFCNNAAAGSGQFVRNRNGFFCKRQRNCYVCSSIIVF